MRGDGGWLGQAVRFCSRSAAAYKAAFMLVGEAEVEQELLCRCRERYDLLERLLCRLGEAGVAPQRMRAVLGRVDGTGTIYEAAEDALDQAGGADRLLAAVLARAGCQALAAKLRAEPADTVGPRLDGTRLTTGLPA